MAEQVKVLVVEDETIVALDIKNTLRELHFEVTDLVTTYQDAFKSIQKNTPHILLVDIYLANSKSGIELAKDVKEAFFLPVIFLTAYCDEATIKQAIKTNPIAYITKPFKRDDIKSNILLAQYKMNHLHQTQIPNNCKNLGFGFYYDEREKLLFYEQMPIRLSPKERELLAILVSARGQVVTFRTLENFIWPHAPVCDSNLRTLIYRLRTKLEYKLIITVPSVGCKLISPL